MAFIEKSGNGFAVKHGTSGETLARFKDRKAAQMHMAMLHKKFNPKPENRGQRAMKRIAKAMRMTKKKGMK